MALVTKNDVAQIFAIQAPEIDLPPTFANYPRGWDTARSNNGKPTIKQFNYLQQRTDQNVLWIHQNGAALPYDAAMEYAEDAVVVKDGRFKQWNGTTWINFGQDDSALKIANNLSDVPNKVAARTNLGVYSATEVNTAISSAIPPETPNATETTAGKAEIATQAEANTGTNDATIITPKKLKSVNDALPLFTSAQNVVDVTASRTSGTIYTNVNKPKFIAIDVNNSSTGDSVLFQKDNAGNWIGMGVRGSGTRTVYALILPLHQYKYESATTFSKWVETVV